eukprot:COSAG06_NODE_3123_length_5815_cov_12.092897_5_plen_57_part_01
MPTESLAIRKPPPPHVADFFAVAPDLAAWTGVLHQSPFGAAARLLSGLSADLLRSLR